MNAMQKILVGAHAISSEKKTTDEWAKAFSKKEREIPIKNDECRKKAKGLKLKIMSLSKWLWDEIERGGDRGFKMSSIVAVFAIQFGFLPPKIHGMYMMWDTHTHTLTPWGTLSYTNT